MSQKNLPQPNPKWLHDLKKGRAQGGNPKVAEGTAPEPLSTGSPDRSEGAASQTEVTRDEPNAPASDLDAAMGIEAPADGLQTAPAELDSSDQLARSFSINASVQPALRRPHPPRIGVTGLRPSLRTHA